MAGAGDAGRLVKGRAIGGAFDHVADADADQHAVVRRTQAVGGLTRFRPGDPATLARSHRDPAIQRGGQFERDMGATVLALHQIADKAGLRGWAGNQAAFNASSGNAHKARASGARVGVLAADNDSGEGRGGDEISAGGAAWAGMGAGFERDVKRCALGGRSGGG